MFDEGGGRVVDVYWSRSGWKLGIWVSQMEKVRNM